MKKKWNISLLVLFVLVACSLLGIIAVQYTRHIAIQTDQMNNYYKAYYLAKWWSEIWLSLMQLRKEWYSWEIKNNEKFIEQNISSGSTFSLNIQWRSNIISMWHPNETECINPIIIGSWQSFVLPLFIDLPESDITNHFSEQKFYRNMSEHLKELKIKNNYSPWNVNIWIILSSWWQLSELWIFFTGLVFQWEDFFENFVNNINESFTNIMDANIMDRQNWDLQNYIIIANKENKELSFCLELPDWKEFSLAKTYISSFWYAWTKKIWLETIYQQPIPSYLIDSSILE